MKLGPLNTAIRTLKGAPLIGLRMADDQGFEVHLDNLEVTKQSLLKALAEKYPGGRGVETGLCLAEGRLCKEGQLRALGGVPDAESTDDDPFGEGATDGDDLDEMFG